MFVVEEGVEKASTLEEVQALKIQKLIKMLQIADNTVLDKESLYECCYQYDHTIKGFMSYINSQNSQIVQLALFSESEIEFFKDPVFPGGDTEFDFHGKILIEFTHYDGFEETEPSYHNSSFLAMKELS